MLFTSQCSLSDWTQEMESKLSAFGLIHTDALALLIFLFSTVQKIDIMKAEDAAHEQRLDHKF